MIPAGSQRRRTNVRLLCVFAYLSTISEGFNPISFTYQGQNNQY